MTTSPERIYADWSALKASGKGLHALDIAKELAVSEAEMLASACGKTDGPVRAIRLDGKPKDLFAEMPSLGTVKTVTRNPHAVIEVLGTYDKIEFFGMMGQSVSSIDLRIFASRYGQTFAVREETKRGVSEGIQFFDPYGRAVHKVFLKDGSNREAYDAFVAKHTSADQSPTVEVDPVPAPAVARPDADVDVAALRAEWAQMTDTHQFFGLLRKHDVTRTQALRLVGADFSEKVDEKAFSRLLHEASKRGTEFMIFVGNPSMIQIQTGAVKKIVAMGDWINVLDPGFDLHVLESAITSAFVVRKPTADGIVTSLEVYSDDGETIVHVVGKRKPGQKESDAWRETLDAAVRAPHREPGAAS